MIAETEIGHKHSTHEKSKSKAGSITSGGKSNDVVGNRTRDLPVHSIVYFYT
jgi:hypothetical protein